MSYGTLNGDVTVDTSCGSVRGKSTPEAGPRACVFRGLPFAAPPIGERRFLRSEQSEGWSGVLDCTQHGPVAPQYSGWAGSEGGQPQEIIGDEANCLTLSVHSPDLSSGTAPVLVWLHGGGCHMGSGSQYDFSPLVARGMVVVCPNYRLGFLGFGTLSDGDANCGVWDQVTALRWVQEEIRAFGGDPKNVTVAGQSAGAHCTIALAASPVSNHLFNRAIVMSFGGGALCFYDRGEAERIDAAYCVALGAKGSTRDDLKEFSAAQLVEHSLTGNSKVMVHTSPGWRGIEEAVEGKAPPNADELQIEDGDTRLVSRVDGGLLRIVPAIVVDGELLTRPVLELLHEGTAAHLDIMLGSNSAELATPKYGHRVTSRQELDAVLRSEFFGLGAPGRRGLHGAALTSLVEELAGTYLAELNDDYQAAMNALLTDMSFGANTLIVAAELARTNPDGTYAYLWKGVTNTVSAFHGAELSFLLGDPSSLGIEVPQNDFAVLSDELQSAFVAFAREGVPGGGWIPFNGESHVLMSPKASDNERARCGDATASMIAAWSRVFDL